jgi:hypothetical protein
MLTLAAGPAGSGASTGRIVAPTAESPARVDPGAALSAIVRLRLPLTPPPGVQQTRAWEGWTIRLSRRVAVAIDGAPTSVDFPARLVRIRPDEGDRYSVTAEAPAWIPPGLYDLAIEGPGFEGLAAESVAVSGARGFGEGDPDEWRQRDDGRIDLVRLGGGQGEAVLEVAAPASGPGLRAVASAAGEPARRPLELIGATWTTAPGPEGRGDARLLRFRLAPPVVKPGDEAAVSVALERVEATGCRPGIEWIVDAEQVGPTEWRELAFVGVEDPVSVVWDFGDGDSGIGRRVRHRWIFTDDARVSATGFDRVGIACTATTTADGVLTPRRGCGCSAVGGGARRARGRAGTLLGFFLSVALARE